MRKYTIIALLGLIGINSFSQPVLRTKNFNFEPKIDTTIDGFWMKTDTLYVDSVYITFESTPNYGDLHVSEEDLELKFKVAWYDSKVFFLFRHLDATLVNGYNIDGTADAEVADSLVNRDATALYFYFSQDSSRLDGVSDPHLNDSVAWLRFVWQSDTMEARLPGGDIVHSFDDFYTEIIQWEDSFYHWAKLSVDIGELAPFLMPLDSIFFGFEIELDENDKEVGLAPYSIQTRAYMGSDLGENALESISDWSWIYFTYSNYEYVSSLKVAQQNFASIYPNPAFNYLTVRLENHDQINYSMFDITGRAILTNSFEGIEKNIDLYGLNPGTYFLRLQDSKGNFMIQKVLVVN